MLWTSGEGRTSEARDVAAGDVGEQGDGEQDGDAASTGSAAPTATATTDGGTSTLRQVLAYEAQDV